MRLQFRDILSFGVFVLIYGGTTAIADAPKQVAMQIAQNTPDVAFLGYTGRRWPADYGVTAGRCNRDEIGKVVGAATPVATKGGRPAARAVAVVVGTTAGTVIGTQLGGRELDRTERGCFGHALDLARPGTRVAWVSDGGLQFAVTPAQPFQWSGQICRDFHTEVATGAGIRVASGKACQVGDGEWRILN
ncbi:MAG: RT0821/Lpp0805 family surface protein [Burkholderiales bacterium]